MAPPKNRNPLYNRLTGLVSQTETQRKEPMPTREEQVLTILDRMLANIGREALGAVTVATDGVVLAARIQDMTRLEHLGAVAAMVFGVTQRVSIDFKQGQLDETIIKANTGLLMVLPINQDSLIVLDLAVDANLGMARLEVRNALQLLQCILDLAVDQERTVGA
ncbi:MAG: roadblock/LC7 domain-containing protein [Chloroflexota bacterium]